VKHALDPLVALCIYGPQDFLEKRRGRGDVQAAGILDHAVHNPPWRPSRARAHFLLYGDESGVGELRLMKTGDEVEVRGRED
jgi:hypothetical protein